MAFLCPQCDNPSLEIAHALDLPPDARSDEITVQVLRCTNCVFDALAVYEESRRGALDRDCFDHTGYRATPARVRELATQIAACPDPRNPKCPCPSHAALNRVSNHRWQGLDGTQEPFSLQIAP